MNANSDSPTPVRPAPSTFPTHCICGRKLPRGVDYCSNICARERLGGNE